jgi:hypothetical protein
MDNDPTMDSTGFQFQANSTSKWDNELKFAAAGSVRTSIIVLSVFNVIVAFAVTISILLRSWRTLKQVEPIWDFKYVLHFPIRKIFFSQSLIGRLGFG